jgi:hypothetical protein
MIEILDELKHRLANSMTDRIAVIADTSIATAIRMSASMAACTRHARSGCSLRPQARQRTRSCCRHRLKLTPCHRLKIDPLSVASTTWSVGTRTLA